MIKNFHIFICLLLYMCATHVCSLTLSVSGAPVDPQNFDIITTDTPGGFVKICADLNGFGALDRDGNVYMYGDEIYYPRDALPPIVDIDIGNFHVAALGKDGKVYSWGLVQGSGVDYGQTDFPANLPPIKAIAAAGYKTMMLTEDGRVLSFGDTNNGGQEYVPDMPRIVAIACSAYTSVALDADGYVHAWGVDEQLPKKIGPNIIGARAVNYNFIYLGLDGIIHDSHNGYPFTDMSDGLVYRPFPFLSDIKRVTGDSQNYAAIDIQGSIVIWGHYTHNPGDYNPVVSPPDDLPAIKNIVFTIDSAIALGEDGKLYEWGPGRKGQRSNIGTPVETPALNTEPDGKPASIDTLDEAYPKPALSAYILVIALVAVIVFFLTYIVIGARRKRRVRDDNTEVAATGNPALDEILNGISEHISNLHKLDKAGQGKLQWAVRDIIITTEQIVQQLRKHSAGISQIRQFLNYTLPTTVNLLQSYDEFSRQPIQGRNIITAMEKIEGMMETIVNAFHRQLDALFWDKALDVVMELEVMKNMLRQAGDITDIVYHNADDIR
ncbi:MAG: 5-bromo-4-chloroindolyl phosphate hydrolysis family protein [Treponema sp.]|nr:5-bromo-4-chloroindolyl phosphate hydrolysis family protein [Treponema sp.]